MKKSGKLMAAALSVFVLAGMVQIPAMASEGYDPTHLFVTESENAINISWRNPSAALTDVVLYDEDGTVIRDDFSTVAGAMCSESFTGLATGAEKKVKLVFTYSGGQNEIVLEGKATGASETLTPFVGWKLRNDCSATDKHLPLRVTADPVTKVGDSGYSLHITSNTNNMNASSYFPAIRIMPTEGTFDPSKKYVIKFKRRRSSCEVEQQVSYIYNSSKTAKQIAWTSEGPSWVDHEEEIVLVDANGNDARIGNELFMFTVNTGDMADYWIDDLSVCEKYADGTLGPNIIENGDFNTLADAPAQLSVDALSQNEGVVISWTAPSDSARVNVYEKAADDSLSLKASVNASSESVSLSGLDNGTEYTYVIKAENVYGVESEGVEKKVVPSVPVAATEDYLPSNLVVRPGDKIMGFSFTTPQVPTFTGVSVYDAEGELLAENISTIANSRVDYSQNELENGLIYCYKLVFSFSDHENEVLNVSGKVGYDERTPFANWKRNPYDQRNYTPIDIIIGEGRDNSGNSLLITHPVTTEYISIANQGGILEAGQKYKMSFYKKAVNANNMWFRAGGSNSYQVAWANSNYDSWQLVENIFTLNSPSTVGTVILSTSNGVSTEGFWLDDVSLVEVDEDNNVVSDNLVVNGDFESLTESEIPTLKLNASIIEGRANISWASSKADRVNIYEKKADGTRILKGSYAADANSAVIDGITELSLISAVAVNYSGLKGDEVTAEEGTDTPIVEPDKTSDPKYNPTNVIVRGDKSKISVSWRNPETTSLTKVSLVDTDNYVELGTYIPEAGKAYFETINGVTLNDIRNCVLKFEYSDSKPIEIPIEAKAEANSESPFADWSVVYAGETLTHVPVSITADSKVKRSGEYSAHIQSNNTTANSTVKLILTVKENIDYTGKTKYVTKAYVKSGKPETNTMLSSSFALDGGSNYFETKLNLSWNGTRYDNWTERTQEITPVDALSSGAAVIFIENVPIADLWIDDVSIQKVNEDGSLGENLVNNGSFDVLTETAISEEVTNVSAEAMESSAKLSWTKPDTAKAVRIYKKTDDGALLLRAIAADTETVTLNNLINNTEHTFVIKTVSASGMESIGIEVKVTPVEPIFKATEITLIPQAELTSGDFTAQTTIKNNNTEKAIDTVLIVGLYKDKAMVDVEWMAAKIPAGGSTKLSVPITVPEYSDSTCPYTLKAFLWDKIDGMIPYVGVTEF